MDNFTRISVQKAYEMISTGNALTIVDIRDAHSFAQGHVPNAKMLNNENMKDFLQVTDKETPLICYCYHGFSSQQAALFLADQGFKKVYSIDGGWEELRKIHG